MREHLDKDLNKLKDRVRYLVGVVQESLENATGAVIDQNRALAERVLEQEEHINETEISVEEDCLKILALHTPVADDLRLVFAISKINHDLERIGDLAAGIADAAVLLSAIQKPEIEVDLKMMVMKSQALIHKSIESLMQRDASMARSAWQDDAEIDKLHKEINGYLENEMMKHRESIGNLLCVRMVTAALERAADHGVNIAKSVIYMCTAEIVRHRSKQGM